MGAWTTRIFDDDGASDIRAEYRILLGYGVPPEEAYRLIKDNFYKDYENSDDEDVYWLSIALYQWQNGILMDEVKENALRCIDNEEYLERWKDSGEKVYQKRKQVLQTLREKLLTEVNPVRKIPKCPSYYRTKTKWKVGDLLAYRILQDFSCWADDEYESNRKVAECREKMEGKYFLLRVVENGQRPVTRLYPELDYTSWSCFMVYDWTGESIPSEKEIKNLPFKKIVAHLLPNGVKKVVSAESFDYEKRDRKYAEIIYLGNDPSFEEQKPQLYLENRGCPSSDVRNFNADILMSFADLEDKGMVWMYPKYTHKK